MLGRTARLRGMGLCLVTNLLFRCLVPSPFLVVLLISFHPPFFRIPPFVRRRANPLSCFRRPPSSIIHRSLCSFLLFHFIPIRMHLQQSRLGPLFFPISFFLSPIFNALRRVPTLPSSSLAFVSCQGSNPSGTDGGEGGGGFFFWVNSSLTRLSRLSSYLLHALACR